MMERRIVFIILIFLIYEFIKRSEMNVYKKLKFSNSCGVENIE